MSGWDISLSASKLNKFNECRRCFWDYCNLKIEYRGIVASIMGGIDRCLKDYNDRCRESNTIPLELIGHTPDGTKLYGTKADIKPFRHWKSCPIKPLIKTKSGVVSLIMAFDDLLVHPDGSMSPLDGKSKGDVPKDDGRQYYQTQMDVYALSMGLHGWKTSGYAYLWYQYPESYNPAHGYQFGNAIYRLIAEPTRALDLIERAAACLVGGQPDYSPSCEFCRVAQIRVEAAVKAIATPKTTDPLEAVAK